MQSMINQGDCSVMSENPTIINSFDDNRANIEKILLQTGNHLRVSSKQVRLSNRVNIQAGNQYPSHLLYDHFPIIKI